MAAESWKTFNKNAKAVDVYLNPGDFRKFLASEEQRFSKIIEELGLRKRQPGREGGVVAGWLI